MKQNILKTILVPTDFSENAKNAFHYAAALGEALKTKLILINSCHVPVFASELPFEELAEDILKGSANQLKSYSESLPSQKKKMTVEVMAVLGLAVDVIVSTAEEKKVDLIVMGTKGASGLEQILLGSNTSAVMEKSPCSVLAIPENATFHGYKKIVFATDNRDSDIQSINFLAGIASVLKSEIMIVHISDVAHTDDLERDLFRLFEEKTRKDVSYRNLTFHLTSGLHVAQTLNSFVEQHQVDMIALSTRKRNIISKLFDRSLTKKLAYHTHVPLLSLHF